MKLTNLATPDTSPWADRIHNEVGGEPRGSYQRDRDRILHCDSFRKLQYKTQVFVVHEGDFFRTRLTHSLEVAQIGRSLARMLDLTEPLVEAMCLAHDLGHTPFGHAGEDELKQLLKPSKLKWNSNAHSLRVVEELELQYCGYRGLNLTWAVREGLARHKTTYDAPTQDGEYMKYRQPSLEAQVASIADLIAYSTHDIEDALLAGLLRLHDLGYLKLSIWEISWTKANDEFERAHPKGTWLGVDKEQLLIKRAHRHLIDYLIRDVVAEAKKRAQRSKAKSIEQARSLKRPLVAFSAEAEKQVRKLLDFMLDTVYKGPIVARQNYRASFILNSLFKALSKDYRLLPTYVQERMDGGRPPALEVACFLAGLTDRSAADLYAELFAPTERAMGHRMI